MASTPDETAAQRTLRESISAFGLRRIVFSLVVLVFLGVFLSFGFWRDLVFLFTGWSEMGLELYVEDYESVPPHRIHIFVFALMLWTATIGMLAQLRPPRKNIAGQWMAILPWAGLLLALLLAGFLKPLPLIVIFGGLTLLATILHPAGRDLVFGISRANRVMLVLVIVAAVPLLAFASVQLGLQTGAIEPAHDHTGADHEHVHQEHVDHGHFAGAAAFGFLVIGVGMLASLRPDGWWLSAWIAGLMPAVFGVASILFPEAASTADPLWGFAAVLWGLAFIAAAELTQGEEVSTPLGRWRMKRATGTSE